MQVRDTIVVGASAGGVNAIKSLVASVPKKLDAAVFVALHIPAYGLKNQALC